MARAMAGSPLSGGVGNVVSSTKAVRIDHSAGPVAWFARIGTASVSNGNATENLFNVLAPQRTLAFQNNILFYPRKN
jgi:hypothetical protein